MGMKCCPKCGSTDVSPLVFYRPSIWKCSDCGYEGAFIIENSNAVPMPERLQMRGDIIDRVDGEPRLDKWDGSTDDWPKAS